MTELQEIIGKELRPIAERNRLIVTESKYGVNEENTEIYCSDLNNGNDVRLSSAMGSKVRETDFTLNETRESAAIRGYDIESRVVIKQLRTSEDQNTYSVSFVEGGDVTTVFGLVASGRSIEEASVNVVTGLHAPFYTTPGDDYRRIAGNGDAQITARVKGEVAELLAKKGKPLLEALPVFMECVNRELQTYSKIEN